MAGAREPTSAAAGGAPGSVSPGRSSILPELISQGLTINTLRHAVFLYVVHTYLLRAWRHLRAYGVTPTIYQLYTSISRLLLSLTLKIPALKRRVNRELDSATKGIEDKLIAKPPAGLNVTDTNESLPTRGKSREWLLQALEELQNLELAPSQHGDEGHRGTERADGQRVWKGGKISGAVYHGGDEMSEVISTAISKFVLTNPVSVARHAAACMQPRVWSPLCSPVSLRSRTSCSQLHPDVFPGVRRMEAEVVSMVLRLFNAPASGAGTTTSGGTESIIMAVKAARDWGRVKKHITRPEIIVSSSAHAAFHKAAAYFKIKIVTVEVDRVTRQIKLEQVKRAINGNTVLLVGSAPSFGEGIIDDIPGLAALARRSSILCHVDCCLGSFLVPYLEPAGLPSQPFDFRVDGVTSISCDTHKYGFAPKGSSVIMYRTSELRRFQYYVQPDWTGGVYASPSIAGSRPGALIAGTWAALMTMGDDGYTASCASIVGAARRIEQAIRDEIPQLVVMGNPIVSVVAFASAGKVNIYEVGDNMSKKGWHLNGLATDPPAVHIACTRLTVPVVDDFISDLKASVKEARTRSAQPGSMAVLYGLGASSAIGPGLVTEMASRFIDTLYKLR
ncbi:PLP-dependent transferase [Ceraceosorus guamensis]|uniref:sphinganine-1-phosphate aldolase n=1 Tax=Ceraceosorus guamensis TaxID=1522189 RepID=A0A316W5A4_9BASI|nr:PLP-dependent transferase [Ceraceosorus guamensis]PWN43891.1 PLP-dependent transferase [Ceraceosorus guamensis]